MSCDSDSLGEIFLVSSECTIFSTTLTFARHSFIKTVKMKAFIVLLLVGVALCNVAMAADEDEYLRTRTLKASPVTEDGKRCTGCVPGTHCNDFAGNWLWRASLVAGNENITQAGSQAGAGVGQVSISTDCEFTFSGWQLPLEGPYASTVQTTYEDIYYSVKQHRFRLGSPAYLNCQMAIPNQSAMYCIGSSLFGTYSSRDVYQWEFVRGAQ